MALLAISLPPHQTAQKMVLLEVIQSDLLPTPEDACLLTLDTHGDVSLRQSVHVTPRGAAGTFWIPLVQRLLELRERRARVASTDAFSKFLRPGTSTLFVVTRAQVTFDRVLALASAIGAHVLSFKLSRQSEFALTLTSMMPNATCNAI